MTCNIIYKQVLWEQNITDYTIGLDFLEYVTGIWTYFIYLVRCFNSPYWTAKGPFYWPLRRFATAWKSLTYVVNKANLVYIWEIHFPIFSAEIGLYIAMTYQSISSLRVNIWTFPIKFLLKNPFKLNNINKIKILLSKIIINKYLSLYNFQIVRVC